MRRGGGSGKKVFCHENGPQLLIGYLILLIFIKDFTRLETVFAKYSTTVKPGYRDFEGE